MTTDTDSPDLFSWAPSVKPEPVGPARLYVFPSVRRRGMIVRTAQRAAAAKDPENTIRATVSRTRDAHRRKGIADAVADQDVASLETAIRCAMARRGGRRTS